MTDSLRLENTSKHINDFLMTDHAFTKSSGHMHAPSIRIKNYDKAMGHLSEGQVKLETGGGMNNDITLL